MQMLNFLRLGFESSASLVMWILLALLVLSLGLWIERIIFLFFKCRKKLTVTRQMVRHVEEGHRLVWLFRQYNHTKRCYTHRR